MDSLIKRLRRFEARARTSARWDYTPEIFEGDTDGQAFAAVGIAPTERDTVILLTRFAPCKPGDRFCSVVQAAA
jgi:hypothetical protein